MCSRNEFLPLHSTDFSEALLEAHETEVARLKTYYEVNTSRAQYLLRGKHLQSSILITR